MTQRLLFKSLALMPDTHPGKLAAGLFTGMVGCEWCGWRGELGHSHFAGSTVDGTVVRFSCNDPRCMQSLAKGLAPRWPASERAEA